MRLPALLFVAATACGGKSNPPPELPAPATSSLLDCSKVADHVAGTVRAGNPRAGVTPAAVQDMILVRCKTDGWTDETKHCLYAIKTISEGRDCENTLTDEQRTAIKASAAALRKEASTPTEPDNSSADWVSHVVEPTSK